jgi:hypothetical protein
MSKRATGLEKAIKVIDDKLAALNWLREELLAQQDKSDLAAARPPQFQTVAK